MQPHLRRVAALFVALSCAACGSAPNRAPAERDTQAKMFTPSAGKAAIYIYRTAGWRGSAVKYPVTIDGRMIGSLHNGTFFLVEVMPGPHDVWVGWTPTMQRSGNDPINARLAHFPFAATPGSVHFVRASQKTQDHRAVDPITGKRELLGCCVLAEPHAPAQPKLFN